jgi:hypothetical protein
LPFGLTKNWLLKPIFVRVNPDKALLGLSSDFAGNCKISVKKDDKARI